MVRTVRIELTVARLELAALPLSYARMMVLENWIFTSISHSFP